MSKFLGAQPAPKYNIGAVVTWSLNGSVIYSTITLIRCIWSVKGPIIDYFMEDRGSWCQESSITGEMQQKAP